MDGYGMVEKNITLHYLQNKQQMILGYEVEGIENISTTDPVLIIYYHGAIPIDVYYFIAKVFLYKNRLVHTVADNFLFKIPGDFFSFFLFFFFW